jgi:hypothetical protein
MNISFILWSGNTIGYSVSGAVWTAREFKVRSLELFAKVRDGMRD